MKRRYYVSDQFLPIIPILVGLGMILFAITADWLGVGGQPGFGGYQRNLLLVGSLILVSGVFLATPFGGRIVQKWSGLTTIYGKPLKGHQHLVIALWFGFLTGVIEALVLAIQKTFFHHIIGLSKDVYWMSPLANLLLFSVLGLLFFLIAWIAPNYIPLHLTVFFFTFLGILNFTYLFYQISQIASILLATGVAIQTVRIVVPRQDRFYAFILRSLVWIVTFNALLVISM